MLLQRLHAGCGEGTDFFSRKATGNATANDTVISSCSRPSKPFLLFTQQLVVGLCDPKCNQFLFVRVCVTRGVVLGSGAETLRHEEEAEFSGGPSGVRRSCTFMK